MWCWRICSVGTKHRQTNADDCNAAVANAGDTSIVMDSMLKDDNDDVAHDTDDALDDSQIVHKNQVSYSKNSVSYHMIIINATSC
jgi:hypothetical protein